MGFAVITDWSFEEGRIIDAAKQGDEEALLRLLDRYFPQIHKWMLARTHDDDQAAALAEKVYHRMLAELPAYQWRHTPVVTWLYGISRAVMDEATEEENKSGAPVAGKL